MSGTSVWIPIAENDIPVDGFTGATALADVGAGNFNFSFSEAFWGFMPGSIGETSVFAILIGAIILIITGIGSWKIMVSTVAGGVVAGLLFNIFAVNPLMELPFWQHLFLGGFAFGTVFMATDPVSAAQTEKGKWIYGFLIGALAIIIRVVNPAVSYTHLDVYKRQRGWSRN